MPAKNGRNVSLTEDQNAFIEQLVASGRYASASEVVRDALRLLQSEEQARLIEKWLLQGLAPEEKAGLPDDVLDRAREAVRARIREGLSEARRGELIDGEDFLIRWKARLEAACSSNPESVPIK